MYKDKLKEILKGVKENRFQIEDALQKLVNLPYEDLEFVKIDHHRALRKGFPEVVYCENKRPEHVIEILKRLSIHQDVLATRATKSLFLNVVKEIEEAEYNEIARTILIRGEGSRVQKVNENLILIVCAGTSDISVAEEAAVTADIMGNNIERLYDIGVAGIHRLFDNKERIDHANVLIVVAGMDGALPSVISGLVHKPVIAVPTSVGYGANFQGIAPLLTMLNACSPGIVVVNIDNGFGAGYFASIINN